MLPAGCLRSCCVVLFLSVFSKSLSSVTSTLHSLPDLGISLTFSLESDLVSSFVC